MMRKLRGNLLGLHQRLIHAEQKGKVGASLGPTGHQQLQGCGKEWLWSVLNLSGWVLPRLPDRHNALLPEG